MGRKYLTVFGKLQFHIILGLVVSLLTIPTAHSQKRKIKFDHISIEQGLSQSTVKCVLQDSKGFMWFATLDGLNKFDGYNITAFRNDPADTNSISDNYINVIYEDPITPSILWIGTRGGGLNKYNQLNQKFSSYRYADKAKGCLSSNNVLSIFRDRDSTLWVGTDDGLHMLVEKTQQFIRFYHDPEDWRSISGNSINHIVEDLQHNLWIATDNGLNRFDIDSLRFRTYKHDPNNNNSLSNNHVNVLCFDNVGTLWAGTNNGLNKIGIKYNRFVHYYHTLSNPQSISDNKITAIIEDRAGFLWVGTEKSGLNKLDKYNEVFFRYESDAADPYSLSVNHIWTIFQDKANVIWVGTNLGGIDKWNKAGEALQLYRHNPYDPQSISDNNVRSFYEDRKGRIWVGTVGGGLNRWDTKNNEFINYKHKNSDPNSLSYNHVRTILEDSKGNFWVGTDGGGLNKFNPETGTFRAYKNIPGKTNSLSHNRVWKIYEDKQQNIWVATFGGGLNKFNPTTGTFEVFKHDPSTIWSISDDLVTSILEDTDSVLWVGTYGGGLNKFDRKNNIFLSYKNDKDVKTSIGNNRIYCIYQDKNNALWIGAKGSLNRFDPKVEAFKRYTEADGLPNDVILGILMDDYDNLWISTNNGLCRLSLNGDSLEAIKKYDVNDGLQSNEFLAGSFLMTQKRQMLFGGINGFNAFSPQKLKENLHVPEIVISRFKIFNDDARLDTAISEKHSVTLNYTQNSLSFDFVALDYTYPEKNQYAYKMVNNENDWNYVKNMRFAKYTNLSPGKYTFWVKGSNNDGIWNDEGTKLEITITPAFWQTTWFKAAVIVLILGMAFLAFKWRLHRIQLQKKHLEDLVRLRTAEVINQKEEIEAQRDEIEAQRDAAKAQRDQISAQKQEIMDSIVYARRIQTATLPSEEYMKEIISDYFVLFKPKDIVSGDFYWATKKNGKLILIAADCTGHGVPGAFMSMFGVSFLNKIINEKGVLYPTTILNRLRSNIIRSLRQRGIESETRDGMDVALCAIDRENRILQFAGANNPLYLIRNKELTVVKGDKMPIGIYDNMEKFTTHEIKLEVGDCVYIFSDGYADQFGGPKEKKFKYSQLRQLLLEICELPMPQQKSILDDRIEKWKGDVEQVDDILVMGVRV